MNFQVCLIIVEYTIWRAVALSEKGLKDLLKKEYSAKAVDACLEYLLTAKVIKKNTSGYYYCPHNPEYPFYMKMGSIIQYIPYPHTFSPHYDDAFNLRGVTMEVHLGCDHTLAEQLEKWLERVLPELDFSRVLDLDEDEDPGVLQRELDLLMGQPSQNDGKSITYMPIYFDVANALASLRMDES